MKTASTPIETQKPLVKNEKATDVDVNLYRSMISSLMYLTASRPDVMFTVCAYSRFQDTPKTSHLQAVKRIFRYLKGQLKLGLWYPKVSSFNLEAYSDSDYAGANLDKKSTTGATLVKGRLLEVTIAKHSNEALAILEQTTAGVNTPRCDEDSLELKELMVLFVPIYVEKDRVGVNAGDFQLRLLSKDLLLPVETNPAENGGFEQIIDFLNGSSIRYALTASPTIRTSCIKQFWSTAKVKTVNDEVRVQALIDAKRVNIKESSIRPLWHQQSSVLPQTRSLISQVQIDMDEAFARQLEAELNANINWNDVIEQVKRSERHDNAVMRYQALKRKHMIEAQARKNMMIYLKNMAGFKMNFFKGMTYSEIRPIFKKHYSSIQDFLEKVEEEVTIQEKEIKEESHKREGESLEHERAKKQRMDKEAEELKRHLQIMANDDDDVYTEATPLASKNFDKEDLETLWKLVKERLEVKEESEMSLELLRLVRRQLNEGYVPE
nr:hypothetical protein [Tanacetum cinerariifolium]